MKATGVQSTAGTEYFIFETGATFLYDARSDKYFVGAQEVDPAHLGPKSTAGIPIVPGVQQGVTPTLLPDATPTDADDAWKDAVTKSGGKIKTSEKDFKERYLAKNKNVKDGTKPFDVDDTSALKALWGGKARFTKFERAEAIMKMFTGAGFAISDFIVSSESSAKDNPPVLFNIVGHPVIRDFEIHPGGGIHGASYIRVRTTNKIYKIYNSKLPEAYNDKGQVRAVKIDVAIA